MSISACYVRLGVICARKLMLRSMSQQPYLRSYTYMTVSSRSHAGGVRGYSHVERVLAVTPLICYMAPQHILSELICRFVGFTELRVGQWTAG